MAVAWDLETIMNIDMLDKLPIASPKLGNTKNEKLIEAKFLAAKEKQIKNMALDPLYGKICCSCFFGDTQESHCSVDEAVIIRETFKKLEEIANSGDTLVTHNGYSFDIPFLYRRAVILGIHFEIPPGFWGKRYSNDPHFDVAQVWCDWEKTKYVSLNNLGNGIFSEGKIDIDVSTFPMLMKTQEGRNEIVKYCMKDCELTLKIFYKCQNLI